MGLLSFFKKEKKEIVFSQYSSIPRYQNIFGTIYDLDDPESVRKIPMVDGFLTGLTGRSSINTVLYEHSSRVKQNTPLYSALINKAKEYEQYLLQKSDALENNNIIVQGMNGKNCCLSIDDMDGPQFELWCADLLKNIGFSDVEVSGKSGDQGVDILAKKDGIKYAIQCKCYSSDLGNTPIQEVFAGKNFYDCHVGAVMTNRKFTTGGVQLAESTGVLLWDRDWIEKASEICGMCEEPKSQMGVWDFSCTDELFSDAVDVIMDTGDTSPKVISNRLNIGYARAARIIDQMEENGIVGPFQGSKPRNLLITKEHWDTLKQS